MRHISLQKIRKKKISLKKLTAFKISKDSFDASCQRKEMKKYIYIFFGYVPELLRTRLRIILYL